MIIKKYLKKNTHIYNFNISIELCKEDFVRLNNLMKHRKTRTDDSHAVPSNLLYFFLTFSYYL